VRDSDATLILNAGTPTGVRRSGEVCRRLGRPHLVLDLGGEADPAAVAELLKTTGVAIQNIAGPR
jgi:hypothetical protein